MVGGMAGRDTAREEAIGGGSKGGPPLRDGLVNAIRQPNVCLVLVKFKSIVALRCIEGLRQDGLFASLPWYEVDLDGS